MTPVPHDVLVLASSVLLARASGDAGSADAEALLASAVREWLGFPEGESVEDFRAANERLSCQVRALERDLRVLRRSGSSTAELRGIAADLFAEVTVLVERRPGMDGELYESCVREFAARARLLAEAGCPQSALIETFRALTDLMRVRHVRNVLGLRRDDVGDWSAVIAASRLRREARIAELAPVELLGEPETPGKLPLAALRARLGDASLAVFGGVPSPEKQEWFVSQELVTVWVPEDGADDLAAALRAGSVRAVIAAALLSARAWETVRSAASEAQAPLVRAFVGGANRFRGALLDLDASLHDGERPRWRPTPTSSPPSTNTAAGRPIVPQEGHGGSGEAQ